jgi:hypothetical protein
MGVKSLGLQPGVPQKVPIAQAVERMQRRRPSRGGVDGGEGGVGRPDELSATVEDQLQRLGSIEACLAGKHKRRRSRCKLSGERVSRWSWFTVISMDQLH